MSDQSYRVIQKHYEECLNLHGDSFLGVDWPNELDAKKRYSVMLGLINEMVTERTISLLDFGCGASHLYDFIRSAYNKRTIKYTGLDISEAFCELSKYKYPHNDYICLDVLETPDVLGSYDYIIMNGVFTEKQTLHFDQMFEYFKCIIKTVFPKAKYGLAFNVMSKVVDWERDDLFHLSMDQLGIFLCAEITRNFVIRNDYGLYEYTVYIYKESVNG